MFLPKLDMKLRLQFNSIRLRLKRAEVDRLAQNGSVEEKIIIGTEPKDVFRYVLILAAPHFLIGAEF